MDFAEQNPRAGTLARPYDYFIDTLSPPAPKSRGLCGSKTGRQGTAVFFGLEQKIKYF